MVSSSAGSTRGGRDTNTPRTVWAGFPGATTPGPSMFPEPDPAPGSVPSSGQPPPGRATRSLGSHGVGEDHGVGEVRRAVPLLARDQHQPTRAALTEHVPGVPGKSDLAVDRHAGHLVADRSPRRTRPDRVTRSQG